MTVAVAVCIGVTYWIMASQCVIHLQCEGFPLCLMVVNYSVIYLLISDNRQETSLLCTVWEFLNQPVLEMASAEIILENLPCPAEFH